MKCSTSDGSCYQTYWYWLDNNMDQTANFYIMDYQYSATATSRYAVVFKCELVWWLLWLSSWQEYQIWGGYTWQSWALNAQIRDWINTNFPEYDEKTTLITATQGNVCY